MSLILALLLLKCLAGFVLGLATWEVAVVNAAGVPGVLPWAVSAWLALAVVRCWRDGGLDAQYLALLWALTGSWLADRSIRVVWERAGEVPVEGAILAVYVVALTKLGVLRRLSQSAVKDLKRIPRWVWVGVLVSPVMLWSTPGAWLPLTATAVYGPAILASSATMRATRRLEA